MKLTIAEIEAIRDEARDAALKIFDTTIAESKMRYEKAVIARHVALKAAEAAHDETVNTAWAVRDAAVHKAREDAYILSLEGIEQKYIYGLPYYERQSLTLERPRARASETDEELEQEKMK